MLKRPPTSGSIKKGTVLNPKGKPKGAISKFKNLESRMAEAGYDPIQICMKIAMDESVDINVRERANGRLLDKSLANLKAVEHSISNDTLEKLAHLKEQMLQLEVKYKSDF